MRILIIKLSSLGDLFHALPAVHGLKLGLGATIDWVTNTGYVDLVRCFDDVENVIAFPRQDLRGQFSSFKAELQQESYDLIIDLQGLLKSALVARLARGKRRIGPSFHREGSRLFYNSVAGRKNRDRHAVLENVDILEHLGIESGPVVFPVTFPDSSISVPRPRIAITPNSRWVTKNWPPERFAAVANQLHASTRASIMLLGSPEDVAVCHQIEAALECECENLTGKTSLIEMGGILQDVDLLISNDSGPVHMAAASGTPTVTIFGPTDPTRCGPFGDIHRVLKTNIPCHPCYRRTCKQPDIPCITGVKVFQVMQAAEDILGK